MDFARNIGNSKEPRNWKKTTVPRLFLNDGPITPEQSFPEDRRLVNWKKWLDRRKKQCESIESATGRRPHDQVLNSCETVREQIEMRNVIDYAAVPVPIIPDRYRGGPEFWRTPRTLPNRGDPCSPGIAFAQSKKELNIVPELTHVGLPQLIEKEKHLAGLRSREPLWKRSQYLARRRKQLSNEIDLLVPKEPDMNDLAIKNRVEPTVEAQPRIPPITVSDTEQSETEEECGGRDHTDQTIVLKIQDREIVCQRFPHKADQEQSESLTWSLVFSSRVNKRTEKEIVLENKGNRVIVYQWRDGSAQGSVLPLRKQMSPFFFNKTKGVILPGQIVKLKIWYRPRSSAVSTEFWRLVTSPVLLSSPLTFRFWGRAEATTLETIKLNTIYVIDGYLDRRVRDATVREMIDIIMENVATARHPQPAYGSLFLESEVFTIKNPLCHYHPGVLMELHKIYRDARCGGDCRWNMSLEDLHEVLLHVEQPERRNVMLSEFGKLYKECLEPTLYNFLRLEKREVVYNLLCAFFNLFETESMLAKSICPAEYDCGKNYGKISGVNHARSELSTRSTESLGKRRKKSRNSSQVGDDYEISAMPVATVGDCPYKEMFFIRTYELLGETLVRVFASIESFNNLNERDK